MNRPAQTITHLAAAAIGIAIAATGVSTRPSTTPPGKSHPSADTTAADGGKASETKRQATRPRPAFKTGDFKAAWDAIPSLRLPRAERLRLQEDLLREWAGVDLQAALDAATTLTWNESPYEYSEEHAFILPFTQVFSDRPLEAWKLIQSGRYGMATHLLRAYWVRYNCDSNSRLVISLLPEMPESLAVEAVSRCVGIQKPGPEFDAMLAEITTLAGNDHKDWLRATARYMFAYSGDPFERRTPAETWATLPAGAPREFAMMKWGAAILSREQDAATAELATIPPGEKEAAAEAILSQTTEVFSMAPAILDFVMTTDAWESIPKSTLDSIAGSFTFPGETDPKQTVDWAVTLPLRKGTLEIYQAAVAPYIWEDMPRAKDWLEGMEEGSWQRDNGLAVYSRLALDNHGDPEASQWALDSITDPEVKARALKWKHEWKLRKQDNPYGVDEYGPGPRE